MWQKLSSGSDGGKVLIGDGTDRKMTDDGNGWLHGGVWNSVCRSIFNSLRSWIGIMMNFGTNLS